MSLETFYLNEVPRVPRFCSELHVYGCCEDDEPMILVFSAELLPEQMKKAA